MANNKKNDDMIGLAAAGLIGVLALIFGPQLLKGLGGSSSSSSSPSSSNQSELPPPKKPGCGACSMGG